MPNRVFYPVENNLSHNYQKGHNPDFISIFISTRNRVINLHAVLSSFTKTICKKDLVDIWFYVDDDDQSTRQSIEREEFNSYELSINWVIGPRTISQGEMTNTLWHYADSGAGIFMVSVDDCLIKTFAWDQEIRDFYNSLSDRMCMSYINDCYSAGQPCILILNREWINIIGSLYTNYFPYWFDDSWLDQVASMVQRKKLLNVQVELMGGKGKTGKMRNLVFWKLFFLLTLKTRIKQAEILREYIYKNNAEKMIQSQCIARNLINYWEKSYTRFSDIFYMVLEKHFSSVPEKQRKLFNGNSIKCELNAVMHLYDLAKQEININNYNNALSYLECIEYSHIRFQEFKIEIRKCREILGVKNSRSKFQTFLLKRVFQFILIIVFETIKYMSLRAEVSRGGKSDINPNNISSDKSTILLV